MTKLLVGAPAPWFNAPALSGNPSYQFDSVAGRAVLLLFAGSVAWQPVQQAVVTILKSTALFDDERACFFGISIDPADAAQGRIAQQLPGFRWFLDYDRRISMAYGAVAGGDGAECAYEPRLILLDHRLRIAGAFPIQDAQRALAATAELVARGSEVTRAPVLTVPRIFEPELCKRLIAAYEEAGGKDSGFMREEDGKTVAVTDHMFKRRRDHLIRDEALKDAIRIGLERRLLPEIRHAYAFDVTRIERWLVACYDSANQGFFSPHRDNTTRGTAHRVFACTINLNTEDYAGGDLRFPEYGPAAYRAPTGGAVIFSCSLLHEALPVTRGRRFAFVPFFYDDAREEVRQRNLVHLAA